MTNKESGTFVAQVFSHDIVRLLEKIYMATVEPRKPLNDFEIGVIEEVDRFHFKSIDCLVVLEKCKNYLRETVYQN